MQGLKTNINSGVMQDKLSSLLNLRASDELSS